MVRGCDILSMRSFGVWGIYGHEQGRGLGLFDPRSCQSLFSTRRGVEYGR